MKDGNEDDWIFFKELISNESTPTDKRASLIKSLGCFKYNDDNIKYVKSWK